jgi:hypothetical protein
MASQIRWAPSDNPKSNVIGYRLRPDAPVSSEAMTSKGG